MECCADSTDSSGGAGLGPSRPAADRPGGRPGAALEVETRDVTPDVLAEPDLDGGETSFSRYALARASGDDRLVGLPVFLMRGFRHRCVLVRWSSGLSSARDLAGATIGLTGWPDSGNTWTRALLRAEGVDLSGVQWRVGSLAAARPARTASVPGRCPATCGSRARPRRGARRREPRRGLHAVHAAGDVHRPRPLPPPLRRLPRRRDGLLRPDRVRPRHPPPRPQARGRGRPPLAARGRPGRLRGVQAPLAGAPRLLADTTPWLLDELEAQARIFGPDWMPYGAEANAAMTAAFCAELHEQGIAPRPIKAEELFG
ncbi:hypothetical protein ACFQY7_15175 [Actinomadura luteofluorescens]|uniref:hypothetical protein n=1 Tax=Actinomadura luteofluorescens TaxID=46163 RepID=UPI0036345613